MNSLLTPKTVIMKERNIIFYGTLEKSEKLISTDIAEFSDLMVLESRSPFYGYYDYHPGKHNNNAYFYLILDSHLSFAEVHRETLAAKAKLSCKADMDHATLYVNHKTYVAIRVRYLKEFSQLAEVIQTLLDQGVKIHKGNIKGDVRSSTRIAKYFVLEEEDDGIWIDQIASNHAYIQLPKSLNMKEFIKLTKKVKNNWDGHTFDAGLVAFTTEDRVIEAVRIYSKFIHEENFLTELKRLYVASL